MKEKIAVASAALLSTLQARFEQHPQRHQGVRWPDVQRRLQAQPAALRSLQDMEATGGEPDVVLLAGELAGARAGAGAGAVWFFDCSAESPAGRRSACYDRAALDGRKENKPLHSAVEWAAAMGALLLSQAQYRALQQLGEFDLKTSSWIETPADVRALGGALFADRRYGQVFVYHNGAPSYYAARGFRCALQV